MKRVLLFLSITVAVSAITWGLNAQNKSKGVLPDKCSVTLTLDQWTSIMNGFETIKASIKTSSMPANQATFLTDSLIALYQNEFTRQINIQISTFEKAAQQKKDTTKPKK